MTADIAAWTLRLAEVCPRLDRPVARILAGLLARDDLPPDVFLIIADALEESARDSVDPLNNALPFRLLRNFLIRDAHARRGSFW